MTPRSPLGVAALVVAIVAVLVQLIATPIEVSLEVRGGLSLAVVVGATALVTGAVAIVGLVLGIVAVRRDGARAIPSAAIGVAGYVLVGQLAGIVGAVIGALA